jgi:polyhydroxyalkanoate synthesis regulator phasin
MAGATGQEVEKVASAMVAEGNIRVSRAKEILEALRGKSSDQ